ncbi:carbohydrate sulfotransferase 15-like [Babylonia areolata]|uniref:carbohydrate sulfotransferase 15-like n=1 Tax=Babylonia areolata TaxID=304850 RepID=UPI003FD4DACF
MRLKIRSIISGGIIFLSLLAVVRFIRDSTHGNQAADLTKQQLYFQQNPPRNNAPPPDLPLPLGGESRRDDSDTHKAIETMEVAEAAHPAVDWHQKPPPPKDERPEERLPMPHPNGAGNGGMQMQRVGPGGEKSDVEAYDWNEIRAQYFRGDNVPDDILAVKTPRYLSDYKNPCFYLLDPTGEGRGAAATVIRGDVKVRLKCLPYFHLIGVDKSGTTDLWFRLTQHVQVVRNSGVMGKETHWWSWRRYGFDIWIRNAPIRHFDWYLSHFDEPARKIQETPVTRDNRTYHPLITGEGSPTVFWDFTGWDLVPQNAHRAPENAFLTPVHIRHLTPHVRLIVMLRNPVERLYSEYLFLDRFRGRHNISAGLFHEGVVKSIAMYQHCLTLQSVQTCLYNKTLHMKLPVRIMVGMYSVWLKQWLNVFPRHQILILRNEDYAQHMDTHLARVFNFLGLSPLSETEMQKVVSLKRVFERSQSEKAVGDMLPATRQILTDFFKPYNKQLAEMLADQNYLWE